MAELCSLENAFPNINTGTGHKLDSDSGPPFVGGTDMTPTREERRAARKKARRCKGPALTALEADSDRPIMRMDDVNSLQDTKEDFQLPKGIPKATALVGSGYPSYFGKGVDDEEGFSSFSAVPGDDPNYRLQPDVAATFDTKGVEKAMGSLLPDPNLSDRWKPMTETTYTAFGAVPSSIAARPGWASSPQPEMHGSEDVPEPKAKEESWVSKEDRDDIIKRMNILVGRLDQMEKKRLQNTQTELLMFVGGGILLLFTFEMLRL